MALKRIPVPVSIDLEEEGKTVAVTWPGGRVDRFAAFDLRAGCPCAGCVDEISGRRILRPADVDPEVRARSTARIGRYAVQIQWSDGHNTGIYTYEGLLANRYRPGDPADGEDA